MIPGKSWTQKGRVVYNRRKHEFRVRDVLNIMLKMSNQPLVWWAGQELQCNSVFQVAKTSFYPTFLNHNYKINWLRMNFTQRNHQRQILEEMDEIQLKQWIRDRSRQHCQDAINVVNERILGTIEWISKEIVFSFFDNIYDLIWDFWDPYFSAPTLGVWKGEKRHGKDKR